MVSFRVLLLPLSAFLLLGVCHPAFAEPVVDPHFAFVDVNGDGLYAPERGDIGLNSTPSVDVNQLILAGGQFDTQTSQGSYHAPHKKVSLVIPASVTLTLTQPLTLHAGMNLVVHGELDAPSIDLEAGGTLDMAGGKCSFQGTFAAHADDDVIVSGAAITGESLAHDAVLGQITITSGRDIAAIAASDGSTAALLADTGVMVWAGRRLNMDMASLTALGHGAAVCAGSEAAAAITASSLYAPDGTVAGGSRNRDADLRETGMSGNSIFAGAGRDMDLSGSLLESAGAVTARAGGRLTGSGDMTLFANTIAVSGADGIVVDHALFVSMTGACTFDASAGPVKATDAEVDSFTGIGVHARGALDFSRTILRANQAVSLASDNAGLDGEDSVIASNGDPASNVTIGVAVHGAIDIGGVNWAAQAGLSVQSANGKITARSGVFGASAIGFTAGGGRIDVTSAQFSVAPVFGPTGVKVIGYSN
jgi:hypothetical protein